MAGTATTTFFTVDKEALPTSDRFPDTDVVVLREEVEITLHPDLRTEKTVRRAWTYLTEFGRDAFSDVTLQFQSGNQSLTVLQAVTTMRDGFRKETPDYGHNEIVPFPLDRAPDLGAVRQRVVSLVGTEVGAVSVLEFTVADNKPWKEFFFGEEALGGVFPVLEKSFVVNVPEGTPITHAGRNFDAAPEVRSADGFDRYTWTAADLPACDPEDGPFGRDRWIPAVLYSAAGSWAEVTAKWAGRFADATVDHPAIQKLAEERTQEEKDPLGCALKLHKFVLDGIRTLDFHPSAIDFTFRPAHRILDSTYGTALEKGVLLTSLAKSAGLQARLYLGLPAYRDVEAVTFPGNDPTTWVEIPAGKERIFLRPDKTAREANRHHLEELRLVPLSAAGTPGAVKVPSPAASSDVTAELTLKEDLTLEGKVACTFLGAFNPYLRLRVDEKTTLDAFAGECASKLFKGKAEEVRGEILSLARTTLSFKLKEGKAERIGAFVSFSWPDVPKALHGYTAATHRESRCTSLPLPSTAQTSFNLSLGLPKDARVRIPAPSMRRGGNAVRIQTVFEEKEGKLHFRATWRFSTPVVHPEDYGKFRRALTSIANPEARSVLLEGI
ncbi:MAG: DUF3857 domain-containing protein [Planctomycetota bacterium]|jgi:hypothetical protein